MSGVACVFMRNGAEVSRKFLPDATSVYRVHYREPFNAADMDTAAVVTSAVETFVKTGPCCPNCRCVVYHSEDWMNLPAWALGPLAVPR